MKPKTSSEIVTQLKRFQTGFSHIQLEKPLQPGQEVQLLSSQEAEKLVQLYEHEVPKQKVAVFILASGMATRMFRDLYAVMETNCLATAAAAACFKHLARLPFYELLKDSMKAAGLDLSYALRKKEYAQIARYLLTEGGLNYAQKPKWALPFHRYGAEVRPCWLEHAYEARHYIRNTGAVRLHATLRPDTEKKFLQTCQKQLQNLGKQLQCTFSLSYSYQDPCTNSPAVYSDTGAPVYDEQGHYFLRPSGHGALLKNLEAVAAALVFVKNVDNISEESHHLRNAYYKKVLGGRAWQLLAEVRKLQAALRESTDSKVLKAAYMLLEKTFLIQKHPVSPQKSPSAAQQAYLQRQLDRPLRVCGLVRTQNSPGGAPFLCRRQDGSLAPQIVEPAQVDPKNSAQQALFSKASYLNPVDMVCIMDNVQGKRYELSLFQDPETGFITEKSYQGRSIRVQERPGLWNGGMSDWNTAFVEVPAHTFAPVKQLSDLLGPAHQAK